MHENNIGEIAKECKKYRLYLLIKYSNDCAIIYKYYKLITINCPINCMDRVNPDRRGPIGAGSGTAAPGA